MDLIGEQDLRQMWDDLASVHGDKTALITETRQGQVRQFSYAKLNDEINRTANFFFSLGVNKGDKVALHLNNCPEFIFCWFGLAKIGAIMVPINANLLHDECAYLLNKCRADIIVTSGDFYPMYLKLMEEETPLIKIVLVSDGEQPMADHVYDFRQHQSQQPPRLNYSVPLSVDDPAEIMFTSGTTARPKGVVITQYNLRFAGYYTSWQCSLREDDIYLTPMPAYHIDCQCTAAMAAFSVGATFVLLEKFSASAFWNQVCKYRATVTECIPLMIRTLMMQPQMFGEKQHCLREILFYLNLPEQEKNAFVERFGVRLLTSYGMTETIVGVIGDRPGDKRVWPSIGRIGFGYEAQVRDENNHEIPAGKVGEICIKGVPGRTLFKEYFEQPDATGKAFDPEGWLHTGDFGYQDKAGYFYFVDRQNNMIKRCGENVSCVELENIICSHPKIADAAVVGIKDSIRDEAVKAFLVLNENETLNEEEFFTFCEKNMAKFKIPTFMEIREKLPRNCSGKIVKRNLI
ncbi:crotonobetaine/carnitine-CoA ligase [Aeromonas hydrophila]